MMRTEIHWIDAPTPGRLAIIPRPRGGDWLEDEVRSWRSAGVDIVLSLLTKDEVADLDLAQEGALCKARSIEFRAFSIADRSIPTSNEATVTLLSVLAVHLVEGKNIAIHCRQGIGRAPMIAICILVLVGVNPELAKQNVSVARGCPVPETAEQKRWITEFVKDALVVAPK